MAEAKLGIGISLYDKFDDLEVLTEIFRENFEDDYYIVVSCSHPEGEEKIEEREIDIDEYIQADSIDYSPDMEDLKGKIHLISRIFESIKGSMKACFEKCEYAMHLHADAWPLNEEKLKEIIERMEREGKPVAVKGRGPGGREDMFPMGHVNDHFMIFESNYSVEKGLFDHNPLDLMPDRGIHSQLMLILLGNVGWSNVLYYSDNSEQVYWDGESADGVRPMMYNPEWKFLHLATEDFPDDLGKSLQAIYLSENNITEGESIRNLIDKHLMDREEVVEKLEEEEKGVNRKMRIYGLNTDNFTRNISWRKEALENNSKVSDILRNHSKNLLRKGYKLSLKTPIGSFFKNRVESDDPVKRSDLNSEIFSIYSDKVDEENFPEKYVEKVWFKD